MSEEVSLHEKGFSAVFKMCLASVVLAVSVVAGMADEAKVDYNCSGPGLGAPWLEHVPGYSYRAPAPQSSPYFAGFFTPGGGFHLFLPVKTANGVPVSTDDAHRMVCKFHPQLGGSGLRLLTNEEIHSFGYDWEHADEHSTFPPEFYTDDLPLAANEAYMADGQTIRLYWLPDIPDAILKTLRKGTAPPPKKTKPSETRRWSVAIAGYEIDEMDPYWRLTTKVRGSVRFDYLLEAEFTTIKKDDKWTFGAGTITRATLDYNTEYEPKTAWALKAPSCPKCADLPIDKPLRGEIKDDGKLLLKWGLFKPAVEIEAQIIAPCTPMPSCGKWGKRQFVSASFFETINIHRLTLADGWSDRYTTEPSGRNPDRVVVSVILKQLPSP